ncbi:MAG: rhomboid family intramembrane serine protease [Bacteroidia bacterium]
MANPIVEDIKAKIRSGNPVTRLIIINVAVFLVISILRILLLLSGNSLSLTALFDAIMNNVSFPVDPAMLIFKPWTIISYMFVHEAPFHLLWNMVSLYWFGQILSDYTSQKKIIPLYILGGIAGALLTILIVYVPAFHQYINASVIGASGSITAIIIAAATLIPNYRLNLLFVGPVKLVYIALFVVFIDILSLASYDNVGGNLAHLGGALMGYIYIVQYKKGRDLGAWIARFLSWAGGLFKSGPKSKMNVAYKRAVSDDEYNYSKKVTQEQIDRILDKISKSGYESLTKTEKDILFKASNKK